MLSLRTSLRTAPAVLAVGLLAALAPATAADSGWTPAGAQKPGEADRPVWSVAASPAHPNILLVATQGHGILRSTDSGASWSAVLPGNDAAWTVRFDPQQAGIAYAGTQTAGVWKSLDEGKTWGAQNQGLDLNVRAIDLAGDLLVAGTSHGVYSSSDGAATWHSMGLQDADIAAVALVPRPGGATVFAGADSGVSGGGNLLRAQDLTSGWSAVRGNFPSDATVAALAVGSPPATGGERPLLAGTSQGLFRSDDGGANWSQVGGLPQTDFNAVLFNPANPDQVYVGSDGDQGTGGVFRSLDRANTWSPLGFGLPSRPRVTALGLQPLNPVQVMAGTWNPTSGQVGLYRIADPAATVIGASPSPAASLAPRPSVSAPVTAPAHRPVTTPSRAGEFWRNLGLGAGVVLLAGAVLWARRWRIRREDRRTYGR